MSPKHEIKILCVSWQLKIGTVKLGKFSDSWINRLKSKQNDKQIIWQLHDWQLLLLYMFKQPWTTVTFRISLGTICNRQHLTSWMSNLHLECKILLSLFVINKRILTFWKIKFSNVLVGFVYGYWWFATMRAKISAAQKNIQPTHIIPEKW